MNLRKIEHEIEEILSKDTHSWVRLYELIREVEYSKLWRNEYSSFTQWIKHLAYVTGVTESLIWKRKKAGEIYFDYQQRARSRGVSVPNIEDVEVSPDNFELVEKISQGNSQIKDELMQQVLVKDIKRSDLVNTWSTIKTIQAKEGGGIVKRIDTLKLIVVTNKYLLYLIFRLHCQKVRGYKLLRIHITKENQFIS